MGGCTQSVADVASRWRCGRDWSRTAAARASPPARWSCWPPSPHCAPIRRRPHRRRRRDADLAPGIALTATISTVETRSATTVPDGAQSDRRRVGRRDACRARPPREVLTDVRLLGPRLAESAAGPDARIVPLHLADAALLDLVRPGDVVDVLAVRTSRRPDRRTQADGDDRRWWRPTPSWSWCPRSRRSAAGAAIGVVLVALPARYRQRRRGRGPGRRPSR